MLASLMMYRRSELDEAHARLWALIRAHLADGGIDAPEHLSQVADEWDVWTSRDLILGQTCGMPYRTQLYPAVHLVGTPDYGLKDCPPGHYRSAFVVRADDPRADLVDFKDAIFAYNQPVSQSGFAAPYAHTAMSGFWFTRRMQTGAHLASARAVAEGRADIAALDAVTWRNMGRFDALADDLKVLDWTAPTPGLPLITARRFDPEVIFSAVSKAIADLPDHHAHDLGLRGLVRIDPAAYHAIPNPPADAA